jgi:CheY-like chemotaxis protein
MSRTILIVEDYEDSRLFMKVLLESYGYEVIEAVDGLEAVKTIREHFPDFDGYINAHNGWADRHQSHPQIQAGS